MELKIKVLSENAVIPTYAYNGDAAVDLTATSHKFEDINGQWVHSYGTGLAIQIPEGHVGLLLPRSSVYKTPFLLSNSLGCLDSNYLGEVFFKFKPLPVNGDGEDLQMYKVGDRIGQLLVVPIPKLTFKVVDELTPSERGTGGFGSSGS